ncbi:DUF6573 family protein [Aquabacterium sp.]|uniref:DUF6573 family protein n=1 Tax=Aquabacterium sp. TaxID=1872578 RepID=UPI0035B3C31B
MHNDPLNNDPFGELIYSFSRAQAIEDGVLIDVTETAQEAGFRLPVALTSAAWHQTVEWTDVDTRRQTPQDESGRLWDVVWMAYLAARRASGGCRVQFNVLVVPRGGAARRPRLMALVMNIGPGDDGEPVITLMLPNED